MATPESSYQTESFADASQPYRPILDGDEFTLPPLQFFQSTVWNTNKKILIGFTEEERAGIVRGLTPIIDTRNFFFVSGFFFLACSHLLQPETMSMFCVYSNIELG